MKRYAGIAFLLLLMMGSLTFSQAEVRKTSATFSAPELPDMQNIMNVVRKVNLRQVDRATTRTFDEFFARKNQMNESVQLLERATAVRQTPDSPIKAPLRQLPKAY